MARICRSCFRVKGSVASRMSAVNTMIAKPMLLNKMVYSTTSPLSMGRIISSVQRNEMASKESYLAAGIIRPDIRPNFRLNL
jgi:hypothetical protein